MHLRCLRPMTLNRKHYQNFLTKTFFFFQDVIVDVEWKSRGYEIVGTRRIELNDEYPYAFKTYPFRKSKKDLKFVKSNLESDI